MPRTTKKQQKGGNDDKFHYFPNKIYGSYDLKILHKQAISMHHNKIDLNLIADLNIDDERRRVDINSIYLDNEQAMLTKLQDLMKKYGIEKEINKEYFLKCTGWCWTAKLEHTLFIGEAKENSKSIPIFMNDSDDGYFYDIEGKQYYLFNPLKLGKSEILNKQVYLFDTYDNVIKEASEDRQEDLGQCATLITTNCNEGKQPDKVDLLNGLGLYDDQEDIKYMFERLRITDLQTKTIEECLLDYRILRSLNTDLSTYQEGGETKKIYHSNERFNFFDYELIHKSQTEWLSQFDNYPFKKCFLVGFTINSPEKIEILPIFLKPDGWYSDGWNNYYPTFETIQITQKILGKSNMLTSEKKNFFEKGKNIQADHSYLIGKIAYLFEPLASTNTVNNILYNQWSTGVLLTNFQSQITSLVLSGFIATATALTVGGLSITAFASSLWFGGGLLAWSMYKVAYGTGKTAASLAYGNLDTYEKTLVDGGRKTQKRKKNKTIRKKKQHKKRTLYRKKK